MLGKGKQGKKYGQNTEYLETRNRNTNPKDY